MASNATTLERAGQYEAGRRLRESKTKTDENGEDESDQDEDDFRQRKTKAAKRKDRFKQKIKDDVKNVVSRVVINELWGMVASVAGFIVGFSGLNALLFNEITGSIFTKKIKLAWYDKVGIVFIDALVFFILFAIFGFIYWLVDNIVVKTIVAGVEIFDWASSVAK
jgi:hypothetical protein